MPASGRGGCSCCLTSSFHQWGEQHLPSPNYRIKCSLIQSSGPVHTAPPKCYRINISRQSYVSVETEGLKSISTKQCLTAGRQEASRYNQGEEARRKAASSSSAQHGLLSASLRRSVHPPTTSLQDGLCFLQARRPRASKTRHRGGKKS